MFLFIQLSGVWLDLIPIILQVVQTIAVVVGILHIVKQLRQIKFETINNRWTVLEKMWEIVPVKDVERLADAVYSVTVRHQFREFYKKTPELYNEGDAELEIDYEDVSSTLNALYTPLLAIVDGLLDEELFYTAYAGPFTRIYVNIKQAEEEGLLEGNSSTKRYYLLHEIYNHVSWDLFEKFGRWVKQEASIDLVALRREIRGPR